MDRLEAIENLADQRIRVRLDAARFLARTATPEDAEALRSTLSTETVAWVRSALERGVARAEHVQAVGLPDSQVDDDELEKSIHAEAVVEVSGEILHELEPLIGMLRVRLGTEWEEFESSQSAKDLDRIEVLMDGIRQLNTASRVPTLVAVELSGFLAALANEFDTDGEDQVVTSGPEIVVQSNRGLLEVIVRNGIRNAIEASVLTGSLPVLTWGGGGERYFVAVLDSGVGPPAGAERAFEMGRSTKGGHLGMGLTIAQRAAAALGGIATLRSRPEGGAIFEYRGPVSP